MRTSRRLCVTQATYDKILKHCVDEWKRNEKFLKNSNVQITHDMICNKIADFFLEN